MELNVFPLANRASMFAWYVHRHQTRKYTGEPYWNHCRQVAYLIHMLADHKYADDEEILAAAYLHDCVEDQEVTPDLIQELFSERVARLVMEVTDVSKPQDGNRATRKALDRAHLASASPAGATIKLADLISNTQSIAKHDKNFARVYLKEKRLVLPLLCYGDAYLYEEAWMVLKDAEMEIYGQVRDSEG